MQQTEENYDALQQELNKGLHADPQKVKRLEARLKADIEAAGKYVIPNLYPQIIYELL